MTSQTTPDPTGTTAPPKSAAYTNAVKAFAAKPGPVTGEALATELDKLEGGFTANQGALLEALGPDSYNRYVHKDYSEG